MRNQPSQLALKPEVIGNRVDAGLRLVVAAGVVDQRVVRDHLTRTIGASASDVFSFSAGDFRQLARVAHALGKAKTGAAAPGPLSEPASQSCRSVSERVTYMKFIRVLIAFTTTILHFKLSKGFCPFILDFENITTINTFRQ